MRRVLIVMDVTEVEAELLADHLEELGPEYKGYGVKQGLSDVQQQFPDSQHLQIMIRSRASTDLGGPETPDFKERDQ